MDRLILTRSRGMKWLAVPATLFFAGAIHAQTLGVDCVPIQGQGWQGCAPVGNSSAPQTRWADRWGGIATDARDGILGVAANMSSKDAATQTAMADCQSKGGGSNCKIERWYSNQCVALTISDKGFNSKASSSIDEATKAGMETCTQSGEPHCRTYYTACSLPTRIQ